jgi:hypothetical protein
MARLSDTSPEAEEVVRQTYRRMPFARKWRQMGVLYRTGRVLHAAGVRLRNPLASEAEIDRDWLHTTLGDGLPWAFRGPVVHTSEENLLVVREVVAALTRLNVRHALSGSWASSLQGKMRFTHDADLCAEPFPAKEAEFCASFGGDYYVSLPAVQQAVRQRKSFNVVHTLTGFKVDVFVIGQRPFDLSVLGRSRPQQIEGSSAPAISLVSPEDVVLLKLEWYRLGGEAATQQWDDVLGVLQVQAERLDGAYLDHWAAELGVADLLARARREASL